MKSAWGLDLYDMAAWNATQPEVEEASIFMDFEDMLDEDAAFEKDLELELELEVL